MTPTFIHWDQLWERAQREFRLGPWSAHGVEHWRRVESNALILARENGADAEIVRLFAILHDCKRRDDGHDRRHGHRAAEFAMQIHGELFRLEPGRLVLLREAIAHHVDGRTSSNLTVGSCWDADRLDLDRVGVIPSTKFMSTPAGKRLVVEWFGAG